MVRNYTRGGDDVKLTVLGSLGRYRCGLRESMCKLFRQFPPADARITGEVGPALRVGDAIDS